MRFTPVLSLILASVAIAQDTKQIPLPKQFQPKPFPALSERLGGSWMAQWTPATNTPRQIYGTGATLNDWRGNTIEEARRHANLALRDQGDLLGLGDCEFRESIGARMGRTWSFKFDQYYRGIPCIDGRADVRINMKGVLAMIGANAWPIPAGFDTTPKLTETEAEARAWLALDQRPTGVPQPGKVRTGRLVVWGDIEAAEQTAVHLAWEIPISNVDARGEGLIGRSYVDAMTGELLKYRSDKHECGTPGCAVEVGPHGAQPAAPVQTTVTVQAWTRVGLDATAALVNTALPGIVLSVPGVGTVTTDNNGQFTVDINAPVNVSINGIDGRHHNLISGANQPSGVFTLTPGIANTIQLGTSADTPEVAAHVTASYWVDRTNEFSRSILGNSAQLNTASLIATTVNIASTCNAFYSGNSINFYQTGGGCNNTAFSTVISHEWGHGLDDRYGGISNASGDGLSEGWGDIFGCYIMDSPSLGQGFQTAGVALRNGNNTKLYGSQTEVHAAGEVWMGFAWRYRENLRTAFGTQTAQAVSNDTVIGSIVADATNQADAVTQVFIADDDDGNLFNGVPHYAQLSAAAIAKGMPYPQFQPVTLVHTPLGDTGDRYNSRLVTTRAIVNDAGALTQVRLVYTVAGGAQQVRNMVTDTTADGFRAMLPGLASGLVSYHVEATTTTGTGRFPLSGEINYTVNGGLGGTYVQFHAQGFEGAGTPAGWTTGRSSATGTVDWQFGTPNGKSGTSLGVAWADPLGAPTGTRALATDLGSGTANGAYPANINEWVRSPVIDCTGRTGVVLRFKRWLTVEEAIYDQAQINVNGVRVWQNPDLGNLIDTSWQTFEYALPMADNNPSVQVEFRLITDGGLQLGGWTIDDFELGTRTAPPLAATMQMVPEQSGNGQTVSLLIDTGGAAKLFVLVLGDTAGPTSVPGFPTATVGGNLDFFTGISNPFGAYLLNYPSLPGMPAQGILVYSQVLVFETDGSFSLSNPFKNLFVP